MCCGMRRGSRPRGRRCKSSCAEWRGANVARDDPGPACEGDSGTGRASGPDDDAALHASESRRSMRRFGCWTGHDPPRAVEIWWRRRESNPRPKARRRGTLHACPLRCFRARRVETAKYRQALASENLASTRRGAACPPACLMAFGPQPPGEVRANVTA